MKGPGSSLWLFAAFSACVMIVSKGEYLKNVYDILVKLSCRMLVHTSNANLSSVNVLNFCFATDWIPNQISAIRKKPYRLSFYHVINILLFTSVC